jgi:hypothetical protein
MQSVSRFSPDTQFRLRFLGQAHRMTTFTIILLANILLDVALLAGLAFAMTRSAKLTPHRPGIPGNVWQLRDPLRHPAQATPAKARGERAARRLSPALD